MPPPTSRLRPISHLSTELERRRSVLPKPPYHSRESSPRPFSLESFRRSSPSLQTVETMLRKREWRSHGVLSITAPGLMMQPNKTSQPWPVTRLFVNGKSVDVTVAADMPLLCALRDVLALTGTKFGCGIGQCGACTVHLDGNPVRSCVLPISAVKGEITTIEAVGETAAGKRVQGNQRSGPCRGNRHAVVWRGLY
ncbi:MAG TPA: 2Fe-2S iron-sulfur cluster-binding protein [Steroidobacteraceae bacterium]